MELCRNGRMTDGSGKEAGIGESGNRDLILPNISGNREYQRDEQQPFRDERIESTILIKVGGWCQCQHQADHDENGKNQKEAFIHLEHV